MSWADEDCDNASRVARLMKSGQYLIFQGESSSSGIGSDEDFFDIIAQEFVEEIDITDRLCEGHISVEMVNDCWQVYRKL